MKFNYKNLKRLSLFFAVLTILNGSYQIYMVWSNHQAGKTSSPSSTFSNISLLLTTIFLSQAAAKKKKEEETKS